MARMLSLEEYYGMSDFDTSDRVACKVVAVVGSWRLPGGRPGDWAAYQGPSHWTDERVATSGDKIDRKAAEGLFPAMKHAVGRYRD